MARTRSAAFTRRSSPINTTCCGSRAPRRAGISEIRVGNAASKAATSTSISNLRAAHQSARDDHLLNLRCAFVQPEEPHVAIKTFDAVLRDIPCATVHLHRAIGHAAAHLGGEIFGT